MARFRAPRPPVASFDAANQDSAPRAGARTCVRPLALCKPTGVTLAPGKPRRGDARQERSSRCAGAKAARRSASKSCASTRRRDADALTSTLKNLAGRRPGARRVLAARAGRRRPLAASMDLSGWHEALRVRVKSLYTTMRTLYEQIAAPGRSWSRPPGSVDSTATTKPERSLRWAARLSASPRPTSASGRTLWSKRLISRPARKPSEIADAPHRGNAARSRRGRDRLQEWTALDGRPAGTACGRWPARSDAGREQRLRHHRRGRQHRVGHHRGSGRSFRRHLLPARSGARARRQQS